MGHHDEEFSPVGDSFDDFLTEMGIKDEVHEAANKRVIAWQLEQARTAQSLTKTEMAQKMKTSRTQVERVLNPRNVAVSLEMLNKAAASLGKTIRISLVDSIPER